MLRRPGTRTDMRELASTAAALRVERFRVAPTGVRRARGETLACVDKKPVLHPGGHNWVGHISSPPA